MKAAATRPMLRTTTVQAPSVSDSKALIEADSIRPAALNPPTSKAIILKEKRNLSAVRHVDNELNVVSDKGQSDDARLHRRGYITEEHRLIRILRKIKKTSPLALQKLCVDLVEISVEEGREKILRGLASLDRIHIDFVVVLELVVQTRPIGLPAKL